MTEKGLLILPLPCGSARTACWHTTRFIFGKKVHEKLLRSTLKRNDAFYYLVHPGDLLDETDIDPKRELRIERLKPNLANKTVMMEECLEVIRQDGRKWVTMEKLAEAVLSQMRRRAVPFEPALTKC